jgi:glucose-6-phosphate 1-epimerase
MRDCFFWREFERFGKKKKKKKIQEKKANKNMTSGTQSSSSLSFTSSFKTASSSRKQRQQRRRRRAHSLNNDELVAKAASTKDAFVSALNAKFAIPTSVSFFDDECDETKSSSPYVSLTHKNGSTAKVYLFGANCASWTQPTGDEVLFVRPDAKFDESVPIAGESFVVSI